MNTAMLATPGGVIRGSSAADLSGKKGYFVEFNSGNIQLADNAADLPIGVLGDGDATGGSVVTTAAPGTVKVKLDSTPGTVNPGTFLTLAAGGTVKADAGTGARVQVARALESGAADELIEAILVEPVALS